MSTPFDAPYKEKQRALAALARPRPLVSSKTIRAEGLELRRSPKGTRLVQVRETETRADRASARLQRAVRERSDRAEGAQ